MVIRLINFSHPVEIYLALAVMVPMLFAHLISALLLSRLIISILRKSDSLRVKALSRAMWVYLLYHCLSSALSISYPLMELIRWQSPAQAALSDDTHPLAAQYVLFWVGLWELNYFATAPIAIFFLTVERCLAICAPLRHNLLQKPLFFINLATMLICYVASTLFYLAELPLEPENILGCRYAACLMFIYQSRFQQIIKTLFSIGNLSLSIIFLIRLRTAGVSNAKTLKNRIVRFAIWVEIFCEIIPGILAVLFNWLPNIISNVYFNELGIMLCAVDVSICSVYYSRMFAKQGDKSDSVIVTSIRRTLGKQKVMNQNYVNGSK